MLSVCTWNINSVRLREPSVLKLLAEQKPDILCLQEIKSPDDKIPHTGFDDLGYKWQIARGQKSYNGVMILSNRPMKNAGFRDFCGKGDARHICGELENGIKIHNFYVPAGGDIPDRAQNEKFGHKIDFLTEMKKWFSDKKPQKSILVGDLNIAPEEEDVWSHKQLLKIVSHTPEEVDLLNTVKASGNWVDIMRKHQPDGKLYSWWSYRARDWNAANKGRRLDHIWASQDIAESSDGFSVYRDARGWEKPSDHAPVFAYFDI